MAQKTKFSLRNYFQPTPTNIQYFALSLRAIIGGIAGSALLMEANKWLTFSILVFGLILDEVGKFAGHVIEDNKESTTTETSEKITHRVEGMPDEVKETKTNETTNN